MTAPAPHRLAVDLGTSTTVAMLQWPDGRVRPLLFDGSPLLASAVLLGVDGRLQTGRDATHLARGNPERLEPNPKRRVDDDIVLLGEAEVPVRELLAAVLRRVGEEADRVAGRIGQLTLTHPAAWGTRRVALLTDAARRAGLPQPRLVGEPVAAATYFANTMGPALPLGALVLVYDLGAGTCDLTLLRRRPEGFDIVASDGLNDVGGLDVDAAIVAFLEASYGRLWTDGVTRRQLWEDVRTAKEMLSRTTQTLITLPAPGTEVPLGREQFNGLIAPVLRPTIAMTRSLLLDAAAAPAPTTVVVLVGGASRIPLVSTMLHEALGIAPMVIEQPELVVAEGALYATAPGGGAGAPVSGGFPSAAVPVSGAYPSAAIAVSGGFSSPATPVSGGFGSAATPVSGAFASAATPVSAYPGAAAPVSGYPGAAAPVSAYPGTAAPVSPGSGYGRPPAGPAVPPGSAGHRPPMPPTYRGGPPSGPGHSGRSGGPGGPAAGTRRANAALIIAGAVAVLVVLGLGTAGVIWFTGNHGSTPSAGGTTPHSGRSTPAAVKYDMTKVVVENLCTKVDLGHFATEFETASQAPSHTRSLNTTVSTATCSLTRQHGAAVSLVSIGFTVMVYADPTYAKSAQDQARDTAKLNDKNAVTVGGFGDDAVLYQTTTSSDTAGKQAYYTEDVRDGNLRWTTYVVGTSLQQDWTPAQRAQVVDDLKAVAKASFDKVTA
jgi:hypothetical protein